MGGRNEPVPPDALRPEGSVTASLSRRSLSWPFKASTTTSAARTTVMLVMRDCTTSRRFPILSGLLDSALLLLPAAHVPNAFRLLAAAVEETVHGAGKTHVFQS